MTSGTRRRIDSVSGNQQKTTFAVYINAQNPRSPHVLARAKCSPEMFQEHIQQLSSPFLTWLTANSRSLLAYCAMMATLKYSPQSGFEPQGSIVCCLTVNQYSKGVNNFWHLYSLLGEVEPTQPWFEELKLNETKIASNCVLDTIRSIYGIHHVP